MDFVKSPKGCLVCLNSIETTFVPIEESQKIFNVCCQYVKDAINIEFLINNVTENNSSISFCKNCLDCSLNLSQLVEQLAKLKKQIKDLSCNFSETIANQRIQATAKASKNQFNPNENTKFQATNNQKAIQDSSDTSLLHEFSSESNMDSFHLEASNGLMVKQTSIDEIGSAIVKTENDGIFPHCEVETYNMSGYNEVEYQTNCLEAKTKEEIDPLGEIELDPMSMKSGNIITCNSYNIDSKPLIETSNVCSELVSCSPMTNTTPDIVLNRIRNGPDSNRSSTINSNKTSYQVKHIDLNTNYGGSGANNSSSQTNTVNYKGSKGKGKPIKVKGKPKLLVCSFCEKSFSMLSHLRRHCLIHTGEKSYKCSVCEKQYKYSKNLLIHERLHTGERPYKCSYCESAFIRSDVLKLHMKIHNMK